MSDPQSPYHKYALSKLIGQKSQPSLKIQAKKLSNTNDLAVKIQSTQSSEACTRDPNSSSLDSPSPQFGSLVAENVWPVQDNLIEEEKKPQGFTNFEENRLKKNQQQLLNDSSNQRFQKLQQQKPGGTHMRGGVNTQQQNRGTNQQKPKQNNFFDKIQIVDESCLQSQEQSSDTVINNQNFYFREREECETFSFVQNGTNQLTNDQNNKIQNFVQIQESSNNPTNEQKNTNDKQQRQFKSKKLILDSSLIEDSYAKDAEKDSIPVKQYPASTRSETAAQNNDQNSSFKYFKSIRAYDAIVSPRAAPLQQQATTAKLNWKMPDYYQKSQEEAQQQKDNLIAQENQINNLKLEPRPSQPRKVLVVKTDFSSKKKLNQMLGEDSKLIMRYESSNGTIQQNILSMASHSDRQLELNKTFDESKAKTSQTIAVEGNYKFSLLSGVSSQLSARSAANPSYNNGVQTKHFENLRQIYTPSQQNSAYQTVVSSPKNSQPQQSYVQYANNQSQLEQSFDNLLHRSTNTNTNNKYQQHGIVQKYATQDFGKIVQRDHTYPLSINRESMNALQIINYLQSNEGRFRDRDFTAVAYVELFKGASMRFIVWRRASEIFDQPQLVSVYQLGSNIAQTRDLSEIVEGKRSDRSFLAAVGALYLTVRHYNREGCYAVLFFTADGEAEVVIDDYFPTYGTGALYCAHNLRRECMWLSILEKAWMKLRFQTHLPYECLVEELLTCCGGIGF